jgi:elongation factor G
MSESNSQTRPIVSLAISPKLTDERESLQQALNDLANVDPTLRIETGSTDGWTILYGMGELHLEVICHRILQEYKIQLEVGEPKVIYLETIRKHAEAEGKYIRQIGGRGNYAHVKVRLEPRERGSGYQFAAEIAEGALLPEFVQSVNLGIQEALKAGILAGHEMVDLRAVLFDGSYHAEDSNEMAFRIVASTALKEAARKANPVLLEPVMSVEVTMPEEFAGAVMHDLNSRRGRIEDIYQRAGSQVIKAIVPLVEMFGYATRLRSITRGRTECSLHFVRYEVAPPRAEFGADEAGVTANQ